MDYYPHVESPIQELRITGAQSYAPDKSSLYFIEFFAGLTEQLLDHPSHIDITLLAEGAKSGVTRFGSLEAYTGYYAWPRLGFEFLESEDKKNLQLQTGKSSLLDLMARKSGREWWREHGWQAELYFDVHNSRMLEHFTKYYKKRVRSLMEKSASKK